jgi:hypothetical protein
MLVKVQGLLLRVKIRCCSLRFSDVSHAEHCPKHVHIVAGGCLTAAPLRRAVPAPVLSTRSRHLAGMWMSRGPNPGRMPVLVE